jgi:hypothetical protein
MLLKIFSLKKLPFLTQNTTSYAKKWIITLVFKKNANFCRKLVKMAEKVIITLTPVKGTEHCLHSLAKSQFKQDLKPPV